RAKVTEIEESKDLSSLALDELIGNLNIHEVVMEKDFEIYRGKKERVKSIALKAKKESRDDETLTSVSDDEEYAMAVRNFKSSTSQNMSDDLVKITQNEVEMSMMGELNFFLGLQIKQMKDEIFFNQSKYIKEMLKKFGLEDSKPTKMPMSMKIKLTKDDEANSVDSSKYRGLEPFLTLKEPICPRFVVELYRSLEVKRDKELPHYIEFKLGQFTFKLTPS
nr:retrovirus-related Pol polyprotein from transposon TNT 1-94 [Tanacetum cinerariifolium]